jgi:hypothetical protein
MEFNAKREAALLMSKMHEGRMTKTLKDIKY